jgi:uncharacterized membrane protein
MTEAGFFIFLIIFGVVGFVTGKIWGINPYKIFTDIGAFVTIGGLFFILLPVIFNPEDVVGNTDRVINYFVKILPGAVIGDLAGTTIASITGGGRR